MSALTDPTILFFFLGLFVALVRSNLEIPPQVAKFLSLYLLLAIGFKGGQALADVGFTADTAKVISAALLLALATPLVAFAILRNRVNPFDAAAIAATYGSVSAVTFATATQYVADRGETSGGYLTVALVLMESPAIVMAVLLASWVRTRTDTAPSSEYPAYAMAPKSIAERDADAIVPEAAHPSGRRGPDETLDPDTQVALSPTGVLREAFTDGAHLLLIGSMLVGVLSGDDGGQAMKPFVDDLFKGLLAFFLLEMGLLVARQLREVRNVGPFLIAFGLGIPFVNATLALALGGLLGLNAGDLTVLAVLAASGSYIVVPAVLRYAIPEARPSRYFTLALGITFPANIVVGIPVYYHAAVAISG